MSDANNTAAVSSDSLQERLAARIKKAASERSNVSSWLAVEIGANSYLVPLSHASEIFPFAPIHPVPYAQAWFLGIANLRGELVGVTDIEQLLGLPAFQRSEQDLQNARLLTFNPALEINAALLIDKLVGLKSVEAFTRAQPPSSSQQEFMGMIYEDKSGRHWQEINLQKLTQLPAFLSISS